MSCSSAEGDSFTEEDLSSFALPSPYIPTHALENCQYPTVLAKLRDILVKAQQSHSPQIPVTPPTPLVIDGSLSDSQRGSTVTSPRTFSSSSRTSMDSTGSSTMDHERDATASQLPNGHVTSQESNDDIETPTAEPLPALTKSREDHVISPDSGHVTSPDLLSPQGRLRESVSSQPEGESSHVRHSSEDQGVSEREGSQSPHTPERRTEAEEKEEKRGEETSPTPQENGLESLSAIDDVIDKAFHDSLSQESCDSSGTDDTASLSSLEHRGQSLDDALMPLSQTKLPMERTKFLVRRATAPCIYTNRDRVSSFGTSTYKRNYTNLAGHKPSMRTVSNPMGSMRVKTRPNPSASLSLKRPKQTTISGSTLSPLHKPNLKLLKVVLAGSDVLVSHVAKAYAYFKCEEANLLGGLEVRFYHIPLSQASSAYGHLPEAQTGSHSITDLPEPMFESIDRSGNDVHIGRFLAHMDSWYEKNVVHTVHNILRLLPPVSQLTNCSTLLCAKVKSLVLKLLY